MPFLFYYSDIGEWIFFLFVKSMIICFPLSDSFYNAEIRYQ